MVIILQQGCNQWGAGGAGGRGGPQGKPSPALQFFKPNKVQQFQFQTSGILLFMCVQKLYGLEFYNFHQHFVGLILNAEPTEKFLIVEYSKENHNEREFER